MDVEDEEPISSPPASPPASPVDKKPPFAESAPAPVDEAPSPRPTTVYRLSVFESVSEETKSRRRTHSSVF